MPNIAAFSAMAMRSAFSRSFSSARNRSMALPARWAPASTTRKSRSCGAAGCLMIHGERSEYLLLGIADGHAPASSQPEAQNEIPGGAEAMIVGDVFDNRGFVAEGRRTASAHLGANFQPVHRLHVRRRQTAPRSFPQPLSLFVEQQDGADSNPGPCAQSRR